MHGLVQARLTITKELGTPTPVTEDVGLQPLQLVSHARSNHTNHYLIGTEGGSNTPAAAVEL